MEVFEATVDRLRGTVGRTGTVEAGRRIGSSLRQGPASRSLC